MSRDVYLYNDKLFYTVEEFEYTGQPESFTLQPGTYLMICTGARGGNCAILTAEPFKPLGGLAMGELTLDEETTMYAVVGGDGSRGILNDFTPGGYNGGGQGGISAKPSQWLSGPSGGGATDIRLDITPESIETSQVTIPNEYDVLEYISSKNGVYFDTGYIPKTSTTIELDYEFTGETWGNYHNIFGAYNTQRGTNQSDLPLLYSLCLRSDGSDRYRIAMPGGFATDISGSAGGASVLLSGRVIFNVTETELTWHAYGSSTIGHSKDYNVGCSGFDFERTSYNMPTLSLFGQHKTDDGTNFYYNNTCPGKVYSFTISEDGTDVHKFIPCNRKVDDQLGFYDVCTETFMPYNGDHSINILEQGEVTDVTDHGVQFTCNGGTYTISGTATDGDAVCRIMLNDSTYIPEMGAWDTTNGMSFALLNPTSLPNFKIRFGYYDETAGTYTTRVEIDFTPGSYWNTYDYSGLRQLTFNYFEFVIPDGTVFDGTFSPMIVKYQLRSVTTYESPYDPISLVRTFDVHTKQMDSLLSRIIVAGGAGGCKRIVDAYTSLAAVSSGGGSIGGTTVTGYNSMVYSSQNGGSHFGRGQDGIRRSSTDASNNSGEGDGGGGGGWFGGYTGLSYSWTSHQCSGGSGGSSYVLTADSYKPTRYNPDSKYYFQNPYMESGRAHVAKAIVAKYITKLEKNDVVHVICTGDYEHLYLPPGSYRLTCDGPAGATRWYTNTTRVSYGGHTAGTLTIDEPIELYAVPGGCPLYSVVWPDNLSSTYRLRFPNSIFNGGAVVGTSNFNQQCTASGGGTDIRLIKPEMVTETLSIPDGYTEMEYIESEGGPYIDIDYIHKANTRIECKCYVSSTSNGIGYVSVYGARERGDYLSHVFFAQYDWYWYPCYNCNNGEYRYWDSTTPTDQIITIITDGADASWYDENGQLIDGWTNSSGGQVDGNRVMRLFGLNANGSYDPATMIGKMYSFKVYEGADLKCYLLPCKRNSDDVLGMYDIIRQTFYAGTFYNRDFIAGPSIPDEDKTTYSYTHMNTTQSLLSRIIVAGGGGGGGNVNGNSDNIRGGFGGGETGGWDRRNSEYGYNAGPGTQTESPVSANPPTDGGFGYGGIGVEERGGLGGCGGGGWFGGGGTTTDSGSDDDRYGSGGSGYILTDESYKPSEYIPDSKCYLSDPVNMQGGNLDEFGAVTITVLEANYSKLLIQDTEGIKTYDELNETWSLIPDAETITDELLDEYGAYAITNETGLVGEYDVYFTDPDDDYNRLIYNVIPNTLHLITIVQTPDVFDSVTLDTDNFDSNIHYSLECKSMKDGRQRVDVKFDMDDVPTKDYQVYAISMISTQTTSSQPPIRPSGEKKDPTDLLTVGAYNRIPSKHNDYMQQYLLDGTPITKIGYASSKVHNRIVYTLSCLNQTHIRFSSFNMITKEIRIIFEVPVADLNFNYYSAKYVQVGDFLLNNDEVFITAFRSLNYIWRIPLDLADPTDISSKSRITTTYEIKGGRIVWYDNETFFYMTTGDNKLWFYNTRLHEVTDSITMNRYGSGEMTFSGNYLAYFSAEWSGRGIRMLNITDNTYFDATSGFDDIVCSDDTRIFVVSPPSGGSTPIKIYDSTTGTLLGTIQIPMTAHNPLTVRTANNTLYLTFKNSPTMLICKLKDNDVYDTYESIGSIGLPYTNKSYKLNDDTPPDTDDGNYMISGYAFNQYYFFPFYKLFTTNYRNAVKYNMGYKYSQMIFGTNEASEDTFTYDPLYMTFKDTHISIHTGNKLYEAESYSENIKTAHIDRDYKTMISVRFGKGD